MNITQKKVASKNKVVVVSKRRLNYIDKLGKDERIFLEKCIQINQKAYQKTANEFNQLFPKHKVSRQQIRAYALKDLSPTSDFSKERISRLWFSLLESLEGQIQKKTLPPSMQIQLVPKLIQLQKFFESEGSSSQLFAKATDLNQYLGLVQKGISEDSEGIDDAHQKELKEIWEQETR